MKSIVSFISKNKFEIFAVFLLLSLTVFLRFTKLGYSHFYGDETKALTIYKSESIESFLLKQRKGPVQFLTTFAVTKYIDNWDEGTVRMPFAFASTLGIVVLYLLLREKFGKWSAVAASFLYSLSGFSIAFGRTAQYQSILVLFGLLSLLFGVHAIKQITQKRKTLLYTLSGLSLSLSFLSHYDAVFFTLPLLVLFYKNIKSDYKNMFWFLVAFVIPVSIFYVPYIMGGHFEDQTVGYLKRRLSGKLPSSSYITSMLYHPSVVWFLFGLFSIVGFVKLKKQDKLLFLVWALVPLVLFEFVFSSPGTHIHNYILPLLILSGIGVVKLCKKLSSIYIPAYSVIIGIAFMCLIWISARTYVPGVNTGYPWNSFGHFKKHYQLFMYGFPYNRGWDQVATYLNKADATSFYSNDNITIGEYYTRLPADKGKPHYYVSVINNQEFRRSEHEGMETLDYTKVIKMKDAYKDYVLEKQIYTDSNISARIYRKVN